MVSYSVGVLWPIVKSNNQTEPIKNLNKEIELKLNKFNLDLGCSSVSRIESLPYDVVLYFFSFVV